MLELNTLSLSELKDLLKDIEREIKRRQNAEKAKAAQQVRDIMATYGLTSEEVLSGKTSKGSRGSVAPKYANPQNAEQTWTGRGRRPQWVQEALASGKSLDDLAI